MKSPTGPPTGKCTLPMYIGFLMSEPKSSTCTRLSQVMGISHDSVNRFLLRESYEPQDLFNEAKKLLDVVGGTLNVDDTTPVSYTHLRAHETDSYLVCRLL